MVDACERIETDVLIVGAGPAGIAAANRAAASGLKVLMVDENARVGGQISRLPFQPAPGDKASPLERLHDGVEFRNNTVCLGFVGPLTVALERFGQAAVVQAKAVLVATGSTERVYPIPGWTKPGVMTAGAGQTFLKGSRVLPYQRVVVAGTGPLLLAAASQLVQAGVQVAAVVEAALPGPSQWRSFVKITNGRSILAEGIEYIGRLVFGRVPIIPGSAVAEILGDSQVTGVRIRRVGRDWSFRTKGRDRVIDCDAVLFSQGFSSSVDLVAQAGAQVVWNELMQSWEPVRDADFLTTVDGLYTAGDCAGIGGSKIAALEGEVAGDAIAAKLTRGTLGARRLQAHRGALRRLRSFREGMDEVFRVGDGVHTWPEPSTVVCRCQETTAGDIDRALSAGTCTSHGVKLWTRAGMGICQGRTCSHVIDALMQGKLPSDAPARQAPRPRFPIRPASTRVLAALPHAHHVDPSVGATSADTVIAS